MKSAVHPYLPPLEQATQTKRLLVVSRDMAALRRFWSMVESNSWQLETVASVWEALERVQSDVAPHVLILDLPREDPDGVYILRWLGRLHPALPTVLLGHCADAETTNDRPISAEQGCLGSGGLQQISSVPQSLKSLIHSIKSKTERNAIGLALQKTGWNRKAAARLLQVSYRFLLYKIDEYHMNSSESLVSSLAKGQLSEVEIKDKVG